MEQEPATLRMDQDRRPDPRNPRELLQTNQRFTTLDGAHMGDRPAIPSPTKAAVRRACGFGCIICGAPLIEYDHVTNWAECLEHEVDNLALLCPIHHAKKTRKFLSRQAVIDARSSPVNATRPFTADEPLHPAPQWPRIRMGPIELLDQGWDQMVAVAVNGAPLIQVDMRPTIPEICVKVLARNGSTICEIDRNVFRSSTSVDDLTFEAGRIKVFADGRKLPTLELLMDLESSSFTILRASLWMHGILIKITPQSFAVSKYGLLRRGEPGSLVVFTRYAFAFGCDPNMEKAWGRFPSPWHPQTVQGRENFNKV